MKQRKPVAGEFTEKCLECGHVWDDWSRDIYSPSVIDCPKCGSIETETIDIKMIDTDKIIKDILSDENLYHENLYHENYEIEV